MPALPDGLSVCAACGAIRGKTPDGRLSVCYCQGVECNGCGKRFRRPITDHYDPERGWSHVPYFALGGVHGCGLVTWRNGRWYTVLPIVEPELAEYRERMTQVTRAELLARPSKPPKPPKPPKRVRQ